MKDSLVSHSHIFLHTAACESCAATCQSQQTAGLIIRTVHAVHVPSVLQLRIDMLCGARGRLRWGEQIFKSAQWQFLLIWLNQARQMQPIHNSSNLRILHWVLTYITMTSKHNIRGHHFNRFLLPPLLSSPMALCVTQCCWVPSPRSVRKKTHSRPPDQLKNYWKWESYFHIW